MSVQQQLGVLFLLLLLLPSGRGSMSFHPPTERPCDPPCRASRRYHNSRGFHPTEGGGASFVRRAAGPRKGAPTDEWTTAAAAAVVVVEGGREGVQRGKHARTHAKKKKKIREKRAKYHPHARGKMEKRAQDSGAVAGEAPPMRLIEAPARLVCHRRSGGLPPLSHPRAPVRNSVDAVTAALHLRGEES